MTSTTTNLDPFDDVVELIDALAGLGYGYSEDYLADAFHDGLARHGQPVLAARVWIDDNETVVCAFNELGQPVWNARFGPLVPRTVVLAAAAAANGSAA